MDGEKGMILPVCREHIQYALENLEFLLTTVKHCGREFVPDETRSD
jgi:hypothetical protein